MAPACPAWRKPRWEDGRAHTGERRAADWSGHRSREQCPGAWAEGTGGVWARDGWDVVPWQRGREGSATSARWQEGTHGLSEGR